MAQPAKSQEPSMEEILASIRRIIADDDATKSGQRAPETPPEAAATAPPPAAAAPQPPRPQPQAAPAPRVAPSEPSLTEFEAPAPAENEPPASAEAASGSDQSSDILDLTESMAASPPPEPQIPSGQFRSIDGDSDVAFEDAKGFDDSRRVVGNRDDRARLLSNETSAAVDSAFNTLAHTVLVQNARTLEDLVREMLRPMLKSWLDDNLPGVVERLVRAEIERVARGRMG